jgi:hypothetical protein
MTAPFLKLVEGQRSFERSGLAIDVQVDFEAINRLSAWAAEARAEMGEERWAELNAPNPSPCSQEGSR